MKFNNLYIKKALFKDLISRNLQAGKSYNIVSEDKDKTKQKCAINCYHIVQLDKL